MIYLDYEKRLPGVEYTGRATNPMSKFNSTRTEYGGVVYMSKLEADWAVKLDMFRRAREDADRVVKIDRQVAMPVIINGTKVCDYRADFVVLFADDHVEVHEVKGVMTDVAKLKMKLVKACYPDEVIKIARRQKRGRGEWELVDA